jgi:hypothetical protein
VTVSWGFVPVELGFGQPAAAPDTVVAAVKTAALVVNVRISPVWGVISGKHQLEAHRLS